MTADNKAQEEADQAEQDRLAAEAEEQRKMDVADAKSAAMQSYMDADAAAMKAEAQAGAAEATASGSPGAMAARTAATAARTAANAAKAAHDAIMDDMTKAEADMQAAEAATQLGHANMAYMTAKAQNEAIQTAHQIAEEQQRMVAVDAATRAANAAVMAAEMAKNDAEAAAMAAQQASDDAEAAYMKAMDARTDSMMAEAEYGKASDAATAAREAADAAEAAYMAAKMAAEGIMADGTAAEAQAAQMMAEEEKDKAEAAQMTAETEQGNAETAEMAAMTASETHVLGLLKEANAQSETDAEARANAIEDVAMAIGSAAGMTGDADNDSSTTGGDSSSTATAMWPANTPATDDTEEVVMPLMIDVIRTGGTTGTPLEFRTMAAEMDDDTTGDVDETIVTATKIDGLGDFMEGYAITDRGTHAIVFTDKQKGTPREDAETVTVRNHAVRADRIVTNEDASLDGTVGGLDATTRYDHDGNPDTLPLMGTYTCGSATATDCVVEVTGTMVSRITGPIRFNSVPNEDSSPDDGEPDNGQGIIKKAKAANAMLDYLVFGVWLDGDDSADNDGSGSPQIAAFANGGRAFATPVALHGTASYTGSAAGVYTEGTSVDYFEGRASLTANFGDTPAEGDTDTAEGIVTGTIDRIMVGGSLMSDVISLHSGHDRTSDTDGNIETTGAFSGTTSMGEAMVDGNNVTYAYTGTWSGAFYRGDQETDPVEEGTLPHSAAGTFGVTGMDDMGTMDTMDDVTRSYVGAFGAHRPMDDDSMNGN